jgi:hypothetical protein
MFQAGPRYGWLLGTVALQNVRGGVLGWLLWPWPASVAL